MNEKYDMFPETGERIVYVRPVNTADLPEDVREQVGDAGVVYAVHDAAGAPLALGRARRMAFVRAPHNDLAPVPVQ